MTSPAEIVQMSKDHTLASWSAQGAWNPIPYERAEGVYVWDANGKRYLDWSSQLVNVNIGHSHPHVVKAIQEQAAKLTYVEPSSTTEPRARLGAMLAEVTGLSKTLFSNGGTDAIENAMKAARLYTGRQKILTRYRSYHGGTFAAASAGGDPRRLANEPGVPWIVRMPDPYAYRSPVYRGRTQEEGDLIIADMIEEIVQLEGPEYCAAILLEGYSGTSGVLQPSHVFWQRIGEITKKYDLLLIVDEVMSGFGRTGEWFGVDHYRPYGVEPDIMCFAKGITSGYVPLGGTIVSEKIAAHFDKNVMWAGLTYSAHTLACAAGVANMEVYHSENLIERSREMGKVLRKGLTDLAEKHSCIGEIRGAGLHQVIELVKDRATREPMSEYNKPFSEPMAIVAKTLKANGLSTFVRWNMVFNCPPLTITEEQIHEGLAILDETLSLIDKYYTGKE